jgi:outer membrane protein assembly factor BamB
MGGAAVCTPAVADGVAFAVTGDRKVIAVLADTGAIRWTYEHDQQLSSGPAIAGRLLIANDVEGTVIAIDRETGQLAWRVDKAISPDSFPLVVGDMVYAGTTDGRVLGFDAQTGKQVFAGTAGGDVYHAVAADDGALYAPSRDGSLYAIDQATGQRRWVFASGGSAGLTTPAVRDGMIHVVAHAADGDADVLFSIDAATGAERWRWTGPAGDGLYSDSADADTVFVASESGDLRAFSVKDGALRWKQHLGGGTRPAPAIIDDTVYAFGGDNEAMGLDAATGSVRWRVPIDGTAEFGTTVADGRMYAATNAGTLFAIGTGPAAVVATPSPSTGRVSIAHEVARLSGPPDGLALPTGTRQDPQGRIWIAEGDKHDFAIFAPDGTFMERWGTHGSGDGQFDFHNPNSGNNTSDIVFARDGSFYVGDVGNYRVEHFSADRALLGAWGGFGKGNGQFEIPGSLAIDADGNVYVSGGAGRIQVFDPKGTFLRAMGKPGTGDGELQPAGVAVMDDRVYVADWDNHRIAVFTTGGDWVVNWPTYVDSPNSIDVDSAGHVYVTDLMSSGLVPSSPITPVRVFTTDGTPLGDIWAGNSVAGNVAVLAPGRVAVTSGDTAVIYELDVP